MQTAISIIGVICFAIVALDVWRSPATTAKKVVWTLFALLFSILALLVWLIWGRGNAYAGRSARV